MLLITAQHTVCKLPDTKQVIEKEVNDTTARTCGTIVRIEDLIKEEDKLWTMAHITDVVVASFINNNADSSDNTRFDTVMEGIELLLSLIHISLLGKYS